MTFLRFDDRGSTPSGKTHVWAVNNDDDGSFLGLVTWHGPRRKYVFQPVRTAWSIFSPDCLEEIAAFIRREMVKRSPKARFYREDGTWSCIAGNRTTPCGTCSVCLDIERSNAQPLPMPTPMPLPGPPLPLPDPPLTPNRPRSLRDRVQDVHND